MSLGRSAMTYNVLYCNSLSSSDVDNVRMLLELLFVRYAAHQLNAFAELYAMLRPRY